MTATRDGLPETITIDYVFESFSPTDGLFDLSADSDLTATFGIPGIDWTFTSISSTPIAFANPTFDGSADTELINPAQSLPAGAAATVSVEIEVLTLANVDSDGNFCDQTLVVGETADGDGFGDLSTAGLDPDPDGDGSPAERARSCLSLPEDGGEGPNQPPNAVFSISPANGDVFLVFTFDASASSDDDGTVVDYFWDFGDGATGQGQTASHVYTRPGTYAVTLLAIDDGGATDTAGGTVTVLSPGSDSQPAQGGVETPGGWRG